MKRDARVALRHIILNDLEIAVDSGNKEILKQVLRKIHGKDGYEVIVNCQEEIYIHGRLYGLGDKSIMIKEDGHRMFVVYKSQDDGSIWIDVSQYDLQTEAEDLAESQWERDSESAYERYLDYKASFDDPRGQ